MAEILFQRLLSIVYTTLSFSLNSIIVILHPYYIFSQGNTHNSSTENMGITHEKRSSEPFRQLLQRSIVT